MKKTNTFRRSGYTLIEILVSVTLSLMLMLGVTQMFRGVGDTINDTQATINMAANLNSAAAVLRNDLGAIDSVLAKKASELPMNNTYGANAGYLEIIEGQGAPPDVISETFSNTKLGTHNAGKHLPMNWTAYSPDDADGDRTVLDNDDILAFTATAGGLFTGLYDDKIVTTTNAEVVWFVRGTNLYRRVLIIPENIPSTYTPKGYASEDISFRTVSGTKHPNKSPDLEHREYRFGSDIRNTASFPYPMRDSGYYLRMPTLEETASSLWPPASFDRTDLKCSGILLDNNFDGSQWEYTDSDGVVYNQFWDFWDAPNNWEDTDNLPLDSATGSLGRYVSNPRHERAGEDIILTNVIGFDVKVWNPYWVPCGSGANAWEWAPPQFIDLGQDRFYLKDNNDVWGWYDVKYNQDLTNVPTGIPAYDDSAANRDNTNVAGYGFTLKGRYNTIDAVRRMNVNDKWYKNDRIRNVDPDDPSNVTYTEYNSTNYDPDPANPPILPIHMACVYDSWSGEYYNEDPTTFSLHANDRSDPPYSEPITGIQVTIRCFDPRSGNIRQIRVTRSF